MTIGAGSLFADDAHKRFMELTGSRYDAMMVRLTKKKLILPKQHPFTKEQYRARVLAAMNGQEDGFIQCRYCRGFYGIKDIASDHARPLDCGGSVGLDNLEFPCRVCNARKGKMTPDEYLELLDLLEKRLPRVRMEILNRLEISVQLVTGQRANAPVINELKDRGDWQKVLKIRRDRKRAKDAGLGAF